MRNRLLKLSGHAILPDPPTMPGGMPPAWHSYTCAGCRATLGVGALPGGEWAEVRCPGCGKPMEPLAEHRMGSAAVR